MKRTCLILGLLLLVQVSYVRPQVDPQSLWVVEMDAGELVISYGSGSEFPQYAVLHLSDSYFRMNYGPSSNWGTSVVMMPAFWSDGVYYQGAPVEASWQFQADDLILSITGEISTVNVDLTVRLVPPTGSRLIAKASAVLTGSVPIDARPGEAFKPVMFSSMYISPSQWDARAAYAGCNQMVLPASGWIDQPPGWVRRTFGLIGGSSNWKVNAPTMEITLGNALEITGWVSVSNDPNNDNVGYWAASDELLSSWSYNILAAPIPTLPCLVEQSFMSLVANE